MSSEPKILTRDVEASVVPIGTKVTLQKGEAAHITQSLGGTYTVVVNGNMFRIDEKDADALSAAGGCATCNIGGAGKGKFTVEMARSLIGAPWVTIVASRPARAKRALPTGRTLSGRRSDLRW